MAQADVPCDPRLVDAEVEARTPAGELVATAHTDGAGANSLHLAPVSHTLTAVTAAALPRCRPVSVTVTSGPAAVANINCDTGIR